MSPSAQQIRATGTFLYCGDNGYDVWEVGLASYAVPCQCHQAKREPTALERAQRALGDRYTLALFDRDRNPAAFDAASQIAKTWECGAYMVGPMGTGKTHLAKGLLYAALEAGKWARWIHSAHLSGLFSQSVGYSDDATDAKGEISTLKHSQVVVLDDLGSQRKTESGVFEEQLQLFLDEFQGILIVTTNLSGEQMQEAIGRKNISRLAERCAKVEFRGKDQRVKPKLLSAVSHG